MYNKKKLAMLLLIEILLPFALWIFGGPGIYFFAADSFEVADIFIMLGIIVGVVTCFAELIIGIVSLVCLILAFIKDNTGKLELFLCCFFSGICMAGNIFGILFLIGMTYGQSV